MLETVHLFGVKVHRLTMTEAVEAVERLVREGGAHQVVTADTSMLVMAQQDAELRRIVNEASLVTPDSMGVVWAARRLGCPVPERVTGVDLMGLMCARAAQAGWPIYLFGAAPGVADEAAVRLRERYPGLVVAGSRHGFFRPEDEAEIVAAIRSSGARLLFVALGIPKQEKFIARHLNELGVSAAVGVGGSLDVYSGRVSRAPRWVQRANIEWLYRFLLNPRKFSKVKLLPVLVLMTVAARLRRGRGAPRNGC